MINTLSKINLSKIGGEGGVNLNLDNVCKYTVCFFWTEPLLHHFTKILDKLWEMS